MSSDGESVDVFPLFLPPLLGLPRDWLFIILDSCPSDFWLTSVWPTLLLQLLLLLLMLLMLASCVELPPCWLRELVSISFIVAKGGACRCILDSLGEFGVE